MDPGSKTPNRRRRRTPRGVGGEVRPVEVEDRRTPPDLEAGETRHRCTDGRRLAPTTGARARHRIHLAHPRSTSDDSRPRAPAHRPSGSSRQHASGLRRSPALPPPGHLVAFPADPRRTRELLRRRCPARDGLPQDLCGGVARARVAPHRPDHFTAVAHRHRRLPHAPCLTSLRIQSTTAPERGLASRLCLHSARSRRSHVRHRHHRADGDRAGSRRRRDEAGRPR